MTKRKVIVITDGDRVAKKVVERVAKNIGGRAISISAGNPTPITGEEIAEAIKETPYDPVLVMVDDCGSQLQANGETALAVLAQHPDIEILGVVAVASNTAKVHGVPVTSSVTRDGEVINGPVDKDGKPEAPGHVRVEGDTVDILNQLPIPIVIGIGDLGKMNDADLEEEGAQITTRAVEEILTRSNFVH
jgi:stage V sporulation protein AE